MTVDQERFAALLHRSSAHWRVLLDERLRPWGMTQATWRTLWALRGDGERYNQCSLATRLGIEQPTLVRLLDRMENLGLIRREPDPLDRRQKFVAITASGRDLAQEIEGEVTAMRQQMLAGLSGPDLKQGIRLLERILANAAG